MNDNSQKHIIFPLNLFLPLYLIFNITSTSIYGFKEALKDIKNKISNKKLFKLAKRLLRQPYGLTRLTVQPD